MEQRSKKPLFIITGIALVILIALGIGVLRTSPTRTLDQFLEALKTKDKEAAMAFVSTTVEKDKTENAEWFIEDWVVSETVETEVTKEEAWRVDKDGKTFIPTPRYWAHNYNGFVTVKFDDYEDPVIITMRRTTDNTSSRLAQLFRGWEIVNIDYQPLDADDFEEFEDEADLEDGEELLEEEEIEAEEDVSEDTEETEEEFENEDGGLVAPEESDGEQE